MEEGPSGFCTARANVKTERIIVALLCVFALIMSAFSLYCVREMQQKPEDVRWEYAVDNMLCIGDSLTAGSCFANDMGGASIEQRYCYYLARMLNTEVTPAAVAGYSASDWYNKLLEQYDYSQYNAVSIWLGTNYAPTNTLAEDVEPFASPDDYAETETGYYCRLIERILEDNPDCFIVLLNVFASKSDVAEANLAIEAIAGRYGLPVVDVSNMGSEEHPEFHGGISNPHLSKTGNIYVASRIVDVISAHFAENPARCEFGVSKLNAEVQE